MENNQQSIENLVEFISQIVSLNRRLQKKKVDPSLVKLAFAQVDKKRKGYLDLANVYELCGEVSEDELFVVFKWLDNSKAGDVSFEDFALALSVTQPATDKKQHSDPLTAVKQVITVYLQNWDYSKGSQQKLGINEETLTKIYRSICQASRKSSLIVEDLVSVFSQSKKCDSLCKEHVRNMFKSIKTIDEKVFLENFLTFNEVPSEQFTAKSASAPKKNQPTETQVHEEQLLDDIDNEYMAQRSHPNFKTQKVEEVPNFTQQRYPKHLVERQNRYNSNMRRQQVQQEESPKSPNPKTGNVEQLLTNIQKRRDELKKGSQERRKLIQEALQRKKSNFTPTGTPTMNDSDCYSPRAFTRATSTPKTSVYSPAYVNNFIDASRDDLGKMFSKYKEGNQSFSNLESKMREMRFNEDVSPRRYDKTEIKTPQYMERTASSFQQPKISRQLSSSFEWRNDTFRSNVNSPLDTPKFSQTSQDRFYQRPCSTSKVDRISQIREKINHLPERNGQCSSKENRQIDFIIEKYRNFKPESNQNTKRRDQTEKSGFSSYLMNQTNSSDFRGIDHANSFTQIRRVPQSYIDEKKNRPTGMTHQCRSPSGSVQKQNLLKRAEQEAARKIQQIQRRAKMKVLERKSAVGLKWVK